jgi:hypothetical protein
MGELKEYRDHRLELGDMIRGALHVARGSGDEQTENQARELLTRLATDRIRLAVVGQFSRASGLPVEVPLAEVAEFVAQAGARRTELQVTSAEVEVPAEILRLGPEFVDTPGVGSA